MNAQHDLHGLCAMCVNGPRCTFLHPGADGPAVRSCEEFTGFPPRPTTYRARPPAAFARVPAGAGRELKGLCTICDHAHGCTFPKPLLGVSHCEEHH